MKKYFLVFFTVLLTIFLFVRNSKVSAEPDCSSSTISVGDADYCIQQLQKEIDARLPAHEKNKEDLADLRTQLSTISKKITNIQTQLKKFESEIKEREEELAYTKKIFEEKTVNQYKSLRLYDPILPFLSSDNASTAFRELTFRQTAADEDRKVMEGYANDLSKLKSDKETLEKSKSSLASLQKQVSEKEKTLASEVQKVEGYLATLTAKQQSIIAAKSGSFTISVGDVELADDYNASIKGFRESAPAGSFAVFSFGGYTHRRGMSQYGAKGRAITGKNYDEILRAYYSFDGYEDRGGITIKVNNGTGVNQGSVIWTGSLEDYVKRIYEVPASWPEASLQAQVIAARTYVLAVTNNGAGTICATQDCQVFKTQPKGGNWESAVISTSGKVMVSGGNAIKSYFSSTTGGYLFTTGWDTEGGGGSDLLNRAYEAKGGSPWLYKAWYRQGTSKDGAVCGKGNPWLTNEEFADIVNAAVVLKRGSDDRIIPVTSCSESGNPYSYSELREKGGVSSITSVEVIQNQSSGETEYVMFNGRGDLKFSGKEFKQAFNLRAPGYLRIPQGLKFGSSVDFAFFNIEKK